MARNRVEPATSRWNGELSATTESSLYHSGSPALVNAPARMHLLLCGGSKVAQAGLGLKVSTASSCRGLLYSTQCASKLVTTLATTSTGTAPTACSTSRRTQCMPHAMHQSHAARNAHEMNTICGFADQHLQSQNDRQGASLAHTAKPGLRRSRSRTDIWNLGAARWPTLPCLSNR